MEKKFYFIHKQWLNETIIIEITYCKRSSHCDAIHLPCKVLADDEWPTQTTVKKTYVKLSF